MKKLTFAQRIAQCSDIFATVNARQAREDGKKQPMPPFARRIAEPEK